LATRETFYSTFYGFKSSPFHVTPDPDNLLLTAAHKHAIGAIFYGIVARKGFVVVTGEVGVGKTSVLRSSLERLDTASVKFVYLYNPRVTPAELYRSIITDLGYCLEDGEDALTALQRLLLEYYRRGVNIVLAIDEAQNMPEETLEDLRVLSNLETRSDKLVQIVLVGQPELDTTLRKSRLRQLQQRIAVRATIPALTFNQSIRYVRHRLAVAGRAEDNPLFSFAALAYIVHAAGGNPRRLNIYCDNALINGLGHRAECITLSIAYEALHQFKQSLRSQSWRLRWIIATAGVVVLAVFFGAALLSRVQGPLGQSSNRRIVTASVAAPAAKPVTTMPAVGGSEPLISPSRVEPLATGASAADVNNTAASSPSGPTETQAGSIGTPADPPPAMTTAVEPVIAPERTSVESTAARIGDAPPLPAAEKTGVIVRSDGRIGVIVRPGDSLIQLCLRIYGRCSSETLRRVLRINPQIRSKNAIVSGHVVVFQTPWAVAGSSDNE
jgi:general secretion pathway protein A